MEDGIDRIAIATIEAPFCGSAAINNLVIVLTRIKTSRTFIGYEEHIDSSPLVSLCLSLFIREAIGALCQVRHIILVTKRRIDFKAGLKHTTITNSIDFLGCHT